MAIQGSLSEFTCNFHRRAASSCLTAEDVAAARESASVAFPNQSRWHPVKYPGRICLPIFVLPLVPECPKRLRAVVDELDSAIARDTATSPVPAGNREHVQRQQHLWLAMMAKGQYLPIGRVNFVLEAGGDGKLPSQSSSAERSHVMRGLRSPVSEIRRWWLDHVWLNPAYRCQRIFSHSVQYLKKWHPQFLVRDPAPQLAGALKRHQEHLFVPDAACA